MKLIIRSAVRRDLQDIAEYIARDNSEGAIIFAQQLVDKINQIAAQPLIYPQKEGWGEAVRSALYRHYHIIFVIEDNTVIILRILHGARDIPDLIRPRIS